MYEEVKNRRKFCDVIYWQVSMIIISKSVLIILFKIEKNGQTYLSKNNDFLKLIPSVAQLITWVLQWLQKLAKWKSHFGHASVPNQSPKDI